MKVTFTSLLAASLCHSLASAIPLVSKDTTSTLVARQNTATDRSVWGNYSIDTDWYSITPDTGVTKEVSLLCFDIT